MPKPEITIQQYITKNKQHESVIKEAINIFKKQQHYENNNLCKICDAELTNEDRAKITPDDFHIVCEKHREYATWYNVQHRREELGYPPNRITQEL
jgi:hypothetical protein